MLSQIEGQYNSSRREGLSSLVCETKAALSAAIPGASLTFDLAISPNASVIRAGYDYPALDKCLTNIVPMAYDSAPALCTLPATRPRTSLAPCASDRLSGWQ